MKPITINTHIDCSNNSKCSVGDILLATKQGAFESVFGTFSVNPNMFKQQSRMWRHISEDSKNWKMPNKADTPLTTTYRPESDISRELNEADAAYYQSLIGILTWIVELGQVDVCLEVSMMSSHLALPREGHLEQVLHIFAYLKKYHNTELVYDPSDPVVDENISKEETGHHQNLAMWKGKKSFLLICLILEVMDSS